MLKRLAGFRGLGSAHYDLVANSGMLLKLRVTNHLPIEISMTVITMAYMSNAIVIPRSHDVFTESRFLYFLRSDAVSQINVCSSQYKPAASAIAAGKVNTHARARLRTVER